MNQKTYIEVIKSKQSKSWLEAMEKEMKYLHHSKTWVFVIPHPNKRVIDCKWIFKVKDGMTSSESMKLKVRLVAKVFT